MEIIWNGSHGPLPWQRDSLEWRQKESMLTSRAPGKQDWPSLKDLVREPLPRCRCGRVIRTKGRKVCGPCYHAKYKLKLEKARAAKVQKLRAA